MAEITDVKKSDVIAKTEEIEVTSAVRMTVIREHRFPRIVTETETEKESVNAAAEHPRWNRKRVKSKKKRAGYNSLLISFGSSARKSIISPVTGCGKTRRAECSACL